MIRILVSTGVLIFSLLTNFQSTKASPAILQLISDQKDLICDFFDSSKFKQTPLATWEVQEGEKSIRLYDRQSPASISLDYKPTRAKWRLLTVTTQNSTGLPYSQMRMSQDCEIRAIRRIRYDNLGRPVQIENLDPVSLAIKSTEPQNPRLEFSEANGNAIKSSPALVALIDTGVNYLLPEFQKSIAFDSEGEIIGYDFWDNDTRPFDKDPRSNPFYPLHHGSSVFSVLARELRIPGISIYRFPANDLCKFEEVLEDIELYGTRVVAMSMGSKDENDWLCFEKKAKKMTDTIFVVSAGNDGIDIDQTGIYPAALALDNIIAVTSGDKFGRLAVASNYGVQSVDVLVPAVRIAVIDHRGTKVSASGSSYAVPRVAALISRFLQKKPDSTVKQLKDFLKFRAIPAVPKVTSWGWIPDPSDDYGF